MPLDLLLDDLRLNVAVADDAIRLTSLTVRSTPRRKATQLPEVGLEPRISASGTLGFSNGSLGAVDGVVRLRDGAWLSALGLGALNAAVLFVRIRTEESVLMTIPAWRAAMADRKRLIPGVF